MVFRDISSSFELNNLNQKKSAAHLMDRFFSFLIDYLVISPFVLFLLYLTFSNGFIFWKSNPMAPENELFFVILSFGYILYFCLIQGFFITLWKATPGQYFLKIKIEFNESDDLIFIRAFFRQMAFWVSFLFLGIPFLSMLTNKKRRTFYDRIGDVSVVSTKNEVDFFTFEKEYKYWQSFMATLVLFVGFLASAFIWKTYSKVVQRNLSFSALQEKLFFCEELENVNSNERLQMAIALNLTNQLTDICLDREADFVLWKQKKSDYSLAYYAKSLTTNDNEKEISYLKQACYGQNTDKFSSLSLGCKISYSFLNNKTEELYSDLNDDNFLNASLKYELSLILKKSEEIESNFAKIEKYNSIKSVKKYQIIEMLPKSIRPTVSERAPAGMKSVNTSDDNTKIINLIEEL